MVRPVDSVALVQGALSLWSYCTNIPPTPGQPGYFVSIFRDKRVRGPIVTTQSSNDRAVGTWYPMAAGVARQVVFGAEMPKYGGVGTYGIRGPVPHVSDLTLLPANGVYSFAPGSVTNIECSRIIADTSDTFSGAHSDIAHPEVAHAVWSAALASIS